MYTNWPKDFPQVTSLVSYTDLRHNPDPEIKALYDRAKNHEDRNAARELINRLVINEGVANVKQRIKNVSAAHSNAIITYVHAVEGKGKNAIPGALANFISETSGLEVDNSIVQSDIVSRTGVKSTWHRLAHRPRFEGNVQQGRDYILVDDVFSAGGTFSELRAFIESNGGAVVDAITMAAGSKSMNLQLAVTPQHILELENKYGVKSLQEFLKEERLYEGNHKSLTDSEARTILGAASLDEARDRIAAARQEGSQRILQENDGERSVRPEIQEIDGRGSVALYGKEPQLKEHTQPDIKDKGSELWGRLQSPPRHNSEPYIKSILAKDDVVKQIRKNDPHIFQRSPSLFGKRNA